MSSLGHTNKYTGLTQLHIINSNLSKISSAHIYHHSVLSIIKILYLCLEGSIWKAHNKIKYLKGKKKKIVNFKFEKYCG